MPSLPSSQRMRTTGVSCVTNDWIASLRGTGGGRSTCRSSTDVMRLMLGAFAMRARPRRLGAGCGASLRRSALRADFPPVLGLVARRQTHFAHCVRYVQTDGDKSDHERAARGATSPALLRASEARRGLPACALSESADHPEVHATLDV